MKSFVLKMSLLALMLTSPLASARELILYFSGESPAEKESRVGIETFSAAVAESSDARVVFVSNLSYDSVIEKLQPDDKIIGVVIDAHGDATSLKLKNGLYGWSSSELDGRGFGRIFDFWMNDFSERLAPKIWVHFISCELSSCWQSENFIDQASPLIFEAAKNLGREVVITSFDGQANYGSMISDAQSIKKFQEAEGVPTALMAVAKPLVAIIRHPVRLGSYDFVSRRPYLKRVLKFTTRPIVGPVVGGFLVSFAFKFSVASAHISVAAPVALATAAGYYFYVTSYLVPEARISRADGSASHDHIQRVIPKVLGEVSCEKSLAEEPAE